LLRYRSPYANKVGMTHLAAYITATGQSQAALASDLGISRSHMSGLVSGAKKPSLELAFAIQRATSDAVPASSWVDQDGVQNALPPAPTA